MEKIWTTGITVKNGEDGWLAECKWSSGKFGQSGYMEGEIATRYYEPTLEQSIDYVLNCMNVMNVQRTDKIDNMKDELGFALYRDEENENREEILTQIKKEAAKRGWRCYIE
jgi:hypothetical protein